MGIEECITNGAAWKRGRVGNECGFQYRSENSDQGVPVGIEEIVSRSEDRRDGGMEHGNKSRTANQDRRD